MSYIMDCDLVHTHVRAYMSIISHNPQLPRAKKGGTRYETQHLNTHRCTASDLE